MPVTAKLSREFYDQFGNAIVNELVELLNQVDTPSQSSLRELNELNFARLDARLDAKLAELKAHMDTSLERGLSTTRDSLLRWFVGLSVTLFVTELLAFVGLWVTTRL